MSSAIKSALGRSMNNLQNVADQAIDFSSDDVDYYAVRVYRDGVQGAGSVEGFEELENPIPKDAFEEVAKVEGLERGTYKLYAIGGEQRHILGAVWSLKAGIRSPDAEGDLEKRVAQLEQFQEERVSTQIEGPSDAFALIIERLLKEDELAAEFDLDRLTAFLNEWLRREDPPTPDMYAGQIIEQLFADGHHEVAFRMLDIWFQYDSHGESEQSLLDIATELYDFELTVGNATALGLIKLLDNPDKVGRAMNETFGVARQLEEDGKGASNSDSGSQQMHEPATIESDSDAESNEMASPSKG